MDTILKSFLFELQGLKVIESAQDVYDSNNYYFQMRSDSGNVVFAVCKYPDFLILSSPASEEALEIYSDNKKDMEFAALAFREALSDDFTLFNEDNTDLGFRDELIDDFTHFNEDNKDLEFGNKLSLDFTHFNEHNTDLEFEDGLSLDSPFNGE